MFADRGGRGINPVDGTPLADSGVSLRARKRVAIMQPTYLPWVGYFGLMLSVDAFILLDSVQFSKRSWQQRNQIKTPSGPQWLTVPVLSKGKREQLISEVRIDASRQFHLDHLKSLELNYRKAPFFAEMFPAIRQVLSAPPESLSVLDIELIRGIRDALGITTPLLLSSEFEAKGENAILLANICSEVGATEYVSPPGSKVYLDESDAFSRQNMQVKFFQFQHPAYVQQHGEFLPYMSAVDLLFNCGAAGRAIIQKSIAD
jgi:hypothetical protein